MRIFHWEAKVGNEFIADGYVLAEDRKEAEFKLSKLPYYDKHEEVSIDNDDCGYDGCEISEDGVAIRWED